MNWMSGLICGFLVQLSNITDCLVSVLYWKFWHCHLDYFQIFLLRDVFFICSYHHACQTGSGRRAPREKKVYQCVDCCVMFVYCYSILDISQSQQKIGKRDHGYNLCWDMCVCLSRGQATSKVYSSNCSRLTDFTYLNIDQVFCDHHHTLLLYPHTSYLISDSYQCQCLLYHVCL